MIRNAEAPAEVDPLEIMPAVAQKFDQSDRLFKRRPHRCQFANLRPDMHVHAHRLDARQRFHLMVELRGIRPWHAKFVARLAGRDVRVPTGGDVGVHAHGHRRDFAQTHRNF